MMNTKMEKNKQIGILMIALFVCEIFFMRHILDVNSLIGNAGDGRLTMLLTEHWWNVFTGKEAVTELAMFYPVQEVIGYTDLFFVYGMIHSVLRLVGLDMYLAYKLTLIIVHVFGVISMAYLLYKKLNCGLMWSLFGTVAFSFSNAYTIHITHTQLAAISFLPFMTILLIGFFQNIKSGSTRRIYAISFILSFLLLTYNSWYIACFTGLYVLTFMLVLIANMLINRNSIKNDLLKGIWAIWKDLILYVVVIAVGFIPFLKIYLPILKESSGFSYKTSIMFLPQPIDIINVGLDNFLLGGIIEALNITNRPSYNMEIEQGYSLVLLVAFVILSIKLFKKTSIIKKYDSILLVRCIEAIVIGIVVSLLITTKFNTEGLSLWELVYHILPVAKSLRAIGRYWLWLMFPMSVIVAYLGAKMMEIKTGKQEMVMWLVLFCLFLSNHNLSGIEANWNKSEQMSMLEQITPPSDAKVFYISDSSDNQEPQYVYQLWAYEIANQYSLKTINGYSGQFPKEWWGIWEVKGDGYENSVRAWKERYGIDELYNYDIGTNTWTMME